MHAYRRAVALTAAATLVALTMALPTPSDAALRCQDRETLLDRLRARYGETPRLLGLDSAGRVIEILASPTGSWTLLVTPPPARGRGQAGNGQLSCPVGAGEALEILPAPPTGVPG